MDANILAIAFGFVGTLIGGLITYLTNKYSNDFQLVKEEKQWQRTQEAERKRFDEERKQHEEEQKARKEKEFYEIISNCIKLLSLHTTDIKNRGSIQLIDSYPYISECIKWITDFSLNYVDKSDDITGRINNFLEHPLDKFSCELLFSKIVNFAKTYNSDKS